MREIKVYNHTEGLYLSPHYVRDTELKEYIREWKRAVKNDCIEKNADHYIFQTTTYDSNNVILEVNLYATPLDDNEFHKRISCAELIERNKGNSIYFGCFHKGVSY